MAVALVVFAILLAGDLGVFAQAFRQGVLNLFLWLWFLGRLEDLGVAGDDPHQHLEVGLVGLWLLVLLQESGLSLLEMRLAELHVVLLQVVLPVQATTSAAHLQGSSIDNMDVGERYCLTKE